MRDCGSAYASLRRNRDPGSIHEAFEPANQWKVNSYYPVLPLPSYGNIISDCLCGDQEDACSVWSDSPLFSELGFSEYL